MKIIPMEQAHIAAVAQLEKVCFSAPWSEKSLLEELENSHACFLVAEEKGMVQGYVGCHMICDEGYIANVAVFPQYRRQGVGVRLLDGLLAQAQAKKLAFVSLEVRKSNEPAQALYRNRGFVTAGVRKNFYTHPTEDGVIMTYQVNV